MNRQLLPYIPTSLALFALILLGLAFQNPTSKSEIIREKVKTSVLNFKMAQLKDCEDRILEKAGNIVDSLLIERARLQKDTISKPPRPNKPDKPNQISPKDSTPVGPLFQLDSLKE